MVFRCGRIWPLLAGARAGVRPHCLCEVAALGRRPFATGALLGEVGVRHDVTTFLSPHERSPSVRYARLMDDVRNDMTQLPQFFETAGRVLDIDQKRQKSMALVSALSPTERKNAERR